MFHIIKFFNGSIIGLCFFSLHLCAAEKDCQEAEVASEQQSSTNAHSLSTFHSLFKVGLSYEMLHLGEPSVQSKDITGAVPIYSTHLGVRLFSGFIESHISYGYNPGFFITIVDLGYQYIFETPFINLFVSLSGYWLHSSGLNLGIDNLGPSIGLGTIFHISKNFICSFYVKTLIQFPGLLILPGGSIGILI